VLKAAYEEKGWKMLLQFRDAPEMQRDLFAIANSEHEYKMKEVKEADRTSFDRTKVPKLPPDGKYVSAWGLSPPTAARMHSMSHPFAASDFCSVQTEGNNLDGVLGVRIAADANRCVSELAVSRHLCNENESTWSFLNDLTLAGSPNFDQPGQLDCHDGQKGAHAAHRNFSSVIEARDFRHRFENILARGKELFAHSSSICFNL
jgi:hypothetical protein